MKSTKIANVSYKGHDFVVIKDLTTATNPYRLYDKWRGMDGRKHSKKIEAYADLRSCMYWIAGAIGSE